MSPRKGLCLDRADEDQESGGEVRKVRVRHELFITPPLIQYKRKENYFLFFFFRSAFTDLTRESLSTFTGFTDPHAISK